jgi:hypothetical protein
MARLQQPALQTVHFGARTDAVHPSQALALCQVFRCQLFCQLLVELMLQAAEIRPLRSVIDPCCKGIESYQLGNYAGASPPHRTTLAVRIISC